MIRAFDSIGANLVEGDGRYTSADALHFFIIARASAREARYWLLRATVRELVTSDQSELLVKQITSSTIKLNNLIRHRRTAKSAGLVREEPETYEA
jgi:four helix bundle protein